MSERQKLWLLFLTALAVRLLVILARGPAAAPVDWADDHMYDSIANTLVTERRYQNPWYPPGYSLLVAGIYSVSGRSPLAARLANALLGALSCVVLYRLGRNLFSHPVGLLAAWLLALYPGQAYMAWHVMPEVAYGLLLLIAVLLAAQVVRTPTMAGGLLLGLTLGAFHLLKSNLFPFPFVLLLWLACAVGVSLRKRLVITAAAAAGFGLLASVTPLLNARAPSGRAALLPANAGNTFWTANNPLADGYFIHAEFHPLGQAFIERHGLKERLQNADVFEQSRIYRKLALLWIRENPGRFALLCLKKLNNAFGLPTQSTVFSRHPIAARLAHLLTYAWIAVLAVFGIVQSRHRWKDFLPLHLALVSYVVMVLIFYGTMRFTLIVMPVMMLFAGQVLVGWLQGPAPVVRITHATREQALAMLESAIRDGGRHYFCFCEASLLSSALKNPQVAEVLNRATATFPDGIAVMMLERLHGRRPPQRISGPSFLLWACEYGLARGWRHFFYGGAPGVAERLAENLQRRFPGLKVVGTFSPPFRELTAEEEAEVARRVRGADLMWIALGSPRQELWAAQHCGKLDVPVLLPVGAAFDFHSGMRPWAPAWVRRVGLEWAFRTVTGGTRTFRRNLRCVTVVGVYLLKETLRRALR